MAADRVGTIAWAGGSAQVAGAGGESWVVGVGPVADLAVARRRGAAGAGPIDLGSRSGAAINWTIIACCDAGAAVGLRDTTPHAAAACMTIEAPIAAARSKWSGPFVTLRTRRSGQG